MKKYALVFIAGLLMGPALADAPKALTIFMNQRPYEGKAIWYKDDIYVPLKDVVRNLGGTFSYNHTTGIVNVGVGQVLAPPPGSRGKRNPEDGSVTPDGQKAFVKATWDSKTLFANNAKVTATFRNKGTVPAHNTEVVCVFQDTMHNVIGTSVKPLGELAPGESRTAEFWLFDPATTPGPGTQFYSPGGAVNPSQGAFATVDVGTYQTQVDYDFKIQFR